MNITNAILRPIPYEDYNNGYLLIELLQLQSSFHYIEKEANKAAEAQQVSYWHDCILELHYMSTHIRYIKGIIDRRHKG